MNTETRLVGELGVLSWLAVGAVLPLRVFDTHIRYLDPETGQVEQIQNPFIHHHNEVLVGLADPWLMARAATRVEGFTLSARLGTTIPLGSTVPNPFLLGDMGLPHEHTQFGTGTFAPIVGVEAYRTFGGVTLDAYALTIQSLYENGYGYKAGNRYAFGGSVASGLGAHDWRFRAMLDRTSETAESWSGVVYTSEGNIGRTDLMAGVEATYLWSEDWRAALAVKVPIYTHVVGGQVDVPLYVSLTLSTHEHVWKPKRAAVVAPAHDWSGLDKKDLSTDGSAAPLEPVLGKITVVDFWADWCVPCIELDKELADVARRHPDELAVRKINVIDTDSPAWAKYLAPGGFELPHAKVFGRDGKLLWERSGAPPMISAGVEDAVTGAHVTAHPEPTASPPRGVTRVEITVTDAGYTPARIVIPRGRPVVLVFTRKSEATCAVDVHFALPDGTKIDRRLPLGQPVEIPLTIERSTEITYACGMNMTRGTIVVQ